jgi:hypothetical protein
MSSGQHSLDIHVSGQGKGNRDALLGITADDEAAADGSSAGRNIVSQVVVCVW